MRNEAQIHGSTRNYSRRKRYHGALHKQLDLQHWMLDYAAAIKGRLNTQFCRDQLI